MDRNVNKITEVVLEPTPPKWFVSQTSALDHSAILPVCNVVNSIHEGSGYHMTCSKYRKDTLYRNVNKTTDVGLEPTPLK